MTGAVAHSFLLFFQKHTFLPNFDIFLNHYEAAKKTKNEITIKTNVKEAAEQLKKLREVKFFISYPNLTPLNFDQEFAHFLDTESEYLHCAVHCYFTVLFPDANISFEEKTIGTTVSLNR